MDKNSLSHTTWNCKYHIVFAPKYRRKIIYGELKQDIANILSALCKRKEVHIIEAEVCRDHIHMLVEIPPKMRVSDFVEYLKGKSTLMIFERHANLKYKYGNRHFWCRGYYVDTVGKNAKKIEEYIQNQLREDLEKERWRYLKKLDTNHSLLSLEGFTDSEGNVLDFIVDEAVEIEETVINAVMLGRLEAALSLLSDSEQALIKAIFFEELSER